MEIVKLYCKDYINGFVIILTSFIIITYMLEICNRCSNLNLRKIVAQGEFTRSQMTNGNKSRILRSIVIYWCNAWVTKLPLSKTKYNTKSIWWITRKTSSSATKTVSEWSNTMTWNTNCLERTSSKQRTIFASRTFKTYSTILVPRGRTIAIWTQLRCVSVCGRISSSWIKRVKKLRVKGKRVKVKLKINERIWKLKRDLGFKLFETWSFE